MRLVREPRRFAFDAALRVLMRAVRRPDPADATRFRATTGLAFPPSDIAEFVPPQDGRPAEMTVNLIGLTGPSGVLPRPYTEIVTSASRRRSGAFAAFLDMLAHRLVAFFGSAGIKYRLNRTADCALEALPTHRPPARDKVGDLLLALTGHGTSHLLPRMKIGAAPLQHYAGLMAMRPRSADRLAALASDWLGRPVEVEQFAGAWLTIPPDERTAVPLGLGAGQWNRLGFDAAIGVRAWDIQARIILRIGPLDRESFEALLPSTARLERFIALVRAYLGLETGFAVNLVLASRQVPQLRLDPNLSSPPRLGWNTWAMPVSEPIGGWRNRNEAVFDAELIEAEQNRVSGR